MEMSFTVMKCGFLLFKINNVNILTFTGTLKSGYDGKFCVYFITIFFKNL